jgi:hypothetical protein
MSFHQSTIGLYRKEEGKTKEKKESEKEKGRENK